MALSSNSILILIVISKQIRTAAKKTVAPQARPFQRSFRLARYTEASAGVFHQSAENGLIPGRLFNP